MCRTAASYAEPRPRERATIRCVRAPWRSLVVEFTARMSRLSDTSCGMREQPPQGMRMPGVWTCPSGCSDFGVGLLAGLAFGLAARFAGALAVGFAVDLVLPRAFGRSAGVEARVADGFAGPSSPTSELGGGTEVCGIASCWCAPPAAAESGRAPLGDAPAAGAVCAP